MCPDISSDPENYGKEYNAQLWHNTICTDSMLQGRSYHLTKRSERLEETVLSNTPANR